MGMKKCPFCAEEIQAEAIKCRFCGTSLDNKTLKQLKKKKNAPGWLVLLAIIGLVVWFNHLGSKGESNSRGEARRTTQSQKYKTIPQDGTVEKLKYKVQKVLGNSNRGVARMYKIEESGKNVKIGFAVNDSLTNGLIKASAKMDIKNILEAVKFSKYNYSEVVIFGTFALTDKYGNSEESMVLKVSYLPATVNKINWESFSYDNVYKIADSVWQHPTLR